MNGQARRVEVFCFPPLGEQHLGGWKAGTGVSNKYPLDPGPLADWKLDWSPGLTPGAHDL